MPALLDGRIDVAVSSLVEYAEQVRSGQLRVLAVSGPSRVAGMEAPTLTEAGVDVVFSNWRGVLAPPGISDSDRAALVDLFHELEQTPEWHRALAENNWSGAYSGRRRLRRIPARGGPAGARHPGRAGPGLTDRSRSAGRRAGRFQAS